jgi:hypothetical protein
LVAIADRGTASAAPGLALRWEWARGVGGTELLAAGREPEGQIADVDDVAIRQR